ncbi:TadE/TadG family type IV pilus assembly protein [Bradyrhizobium sp.]|uniref:TadE/TadG family type IV pilus assembly protein n=1 Tax=Bradyrhizobium sp. TaxID=376 RepID=UPI001DE13B65|nr:TadE/TadG family type IV pilus assembly protein [Bradyrhizobium sp.]MBV8700471.1 pilus assembly protein [Bradyrhizobium sp.]MBV8922690.1 pilus assembly protein [Bradyrhizobium sp.]MBV9981276.1 pilus assembly protein [Bradyrhizobium sp.]
MTNHQGFGRLRALIHEFCRAREGNLAVIFSLAAIPIIGAVGAAVDLSKANDVKTELQNALDAAVLAGVTQTSANQVSTASAVFNGDFIAKYGNSGSASFTQNANGSLSGTATSSVQMSFMAVVGKSSVVVNATATATPGAHATTPVCILLTSTLDAPALLVNSGAQLNATSCEVHVLSTQSPAATFNTTLNAKRICIKGSSIIKNGGANPPAVTSCAAISDPFAGKLPTVSTNSCSSIPSANNNINYNSNSGAANLAGGVYGAMNFNNTSVTLNPGVFCGSINFNSVTNGTLTLNPGLYEIHGTWTVNSGWTVNGSGVTFYLVDQNSGIHFNSTTSATLSAPTTGTYANILFYEPTGLSTSYPTIDSSSLNLTGLVYLPSRKLTANSTSNLTSTGLSMVLSTLTLNSTNWMIAPGAPAMSVASGTATSAYLSQ